MVLKMQGEVTGRPALCGAEATDVPVRGGTLKGRCPHTQRLRPPQLPDQEAIRPPLLPGTLTTVIVGACAYQACRQTTLQRYYTENSKYIFPEKELRGNSPNSYIHVYVCNLYIPTIALHILLQENRNRIVSKSKFLFSVVFRNRIRHCT